MPAPGLLIDTAVSQAVLEICFHFTVSRVLTSAGENNTMYSRNAKIYLITNYFNNLLMTGLSRQENRHHLDLRVLLQEAVLQWGS